MKPKRTGRPPTASRYGKQRPVAVQEAAQQAQGWKKIRWREGSKGWLESRFWAAAYSLRIVFRTADRGQRSLAAGRVAGRKPRSRPNTSFATFLPDYASATFGADCQCRWKIEQDYQQLKEELGLDHYEGRNLEGWHHHVTMVMLAHAFLTLETLRSKKNFWVDPAEDAS